MSGHGATPHGLSVGHLEQILEVTRALAAPFDLMSMLAAVTAAARQVLHADRCSVWLHDAATDELVLKVASDVSDVRIPLSVGLVGACARSRAPINVPDCYADPRFDPSTDRRTGYRTRCSLTLPLEDHRGELVGVMQLLNRAEGVFDAADERLAQALAAQCAVALQRARLTEVLIEGERMRQALALAREVQMSTLPASMPRLQGYDCFGLSQPAEETGGDTFDLALLPQGLLVVLGDATGHGIAPALSVTQMHAMLRMALRVGIGLEAAVLQVNNLMGETLADDRFITAFFGLLDPSTHTLRYLSAGQGPILHWHAAERRCSRHGPTSFPLGAMPLAAARPAATLRFEPGDALLLLSDGVYEAHGPGDELFGEARVEAVAAAHHRDGPAAIARALQEGLQGFAKGTPQQDDVTLVIVQREGLV
ncbi:MAG TPA: GAF domain-containing SpoIIE family protein phosphatase [Burkholderiaceae bacterium]|nr:GAF domain-containing SpoIIE family protein phosphatase [Burkholderiaceae bacterium]